MEEELARLQPGDIEQLIRKNSQPVGGHVNLLAHLLLPLGERRAMPLPGLDEKCPNGPLERRDGGTQFVGRQPNELIFHVLGLFEDADILLNHQRERLACRLPVGRRKFAADRGGRLCAIRLQALPVREGERHGIHQNWQRVTLWPMDDFLQLQGRFPLAQGAQSRPLLHRRRPSLRVGQLDVMLFQKFPHRLFMSPGGAPDTRRSAIGQHEACVVSMDDIHPVGKRIKQLLQERQLYQRIRLGSSFRLFYASPLGDIPVDLENGAWLPVVIAYQHPPAVDQHHPAIGPGMRQLPFPGALPFELRLNRRATYRESCLEETMGKPPQRFTRLPAIEFFSAGIPDQDAVGGVAHQDGVVRQVDEFGLQAETGD